MGKVRACPDLVYLLPKEILGTLLNLKCWALLSPVKLYQGIDQ